MSRQVGISINHEKNYNITLFTGLIGCEKDLNSELTNHQYLNFKDDTINRVDFHESFESLFQPNLEEFTEFSNVNNINVSLAETSISLTFLTFRQKQKKVIYVLHHILI